MQKGLLIIFGALSLALYVIAKDTTTRLIILIFVIGYYLMWAFVHHSSTRTLSLKVVLEYVLIALIAMITLQIALTPHL